MPASERSLRITEAYRERLLGVRQRLERQATQRWPTIEALDGTDWPTQLAVVTAQAQLQAVRATSGYLAAYLSSELGRRVRGPVFDVRSYSGVSRDGRSLEEALQSPLIGAKAALKEGKPPQEALAYGLNRATRMVSVDFDHAHRTALLEAIDRDDRFAGWQRAVRGTCGACAGKATGLNHGLRFQVHPGCQCVSEPNVKARGPRSVLHGRRLGEAAGFTADEIAAVERYTGSVDSFLVNRALRDSGQRMGGRMQQTVDGIDAAMERAGSVGVPIHVQRAIVGNPDDLLGGTGSTVTDLGFGSTTASESWLSEFLSKRPSFLGDGDSIVMDLQLDPRVRAIWGANPAEEELLLQRGCRYVIEGVEKEGEGWRVRATVLPPK